MAQFEDDPDDTPDDNIDPTAAMATLMALGAIADQWNSIRSARDRGLPQHLADEMERGFIEVAEAYLGVTSVAVDIAPPPTVRTPEDARYRPIPGDKFVFGDDGLVWTVTSTEDDHVHVNKVSQGRVECDDVCHLTVWAVDDGHGGTWVPA